jgi:hypothetical protein
VRAGKPVITPGWHHHVMRFKPRIEIILEARTDSLPEREFENCADNLGPINASLSRLAA